MELEGVRFRVLMHDLDEAVAFYRDVLDFDVLHKHGTTISITPRPGVHIVLEAVENADVAPADRRALALLLTNGALDRIEFTTEDCDATFEHLVAADAEVVQEPIDRRDGSRDCAFFDPSGNLLRFTQAPGTSRRPERPSVSGQRRWGRARGW